MQTLKSGKADELVEGTLLEAKITKPVLPKEMAIFKYSNENLIFY